MKRPTFEQFVDYLLRTDVSDYNDHWIPIWLHCRMCQMEFDVIGEWNIVLFFVFVICFACKVVEKITI